MVYTLVYDGQKVYSKTNFKLSTTAYTHGC